MYRQIQLWLCAASAIGCQPATLPAPACDAVNVEASTPASGDIDVYYRAPLTVWPRTMDPGTTLSLLDATGTVVPGAVTVEGEHLQFTPTSGLAPQEDHELVVSASCGESRIPFRTSSYGLPLQVDPNDRVYKLDLRGATWVEPGSLFDEVQGSLGIVKVLARATVVDGALSITAGQGSIASDRTREQDLTIPTTDFQTVAFDTPDFLVESERMALDLTLWEVSADLQDIQFSGTFAADGSTMHTTLDAWVDVASLVGAIITAEDPAEACLVADDFGAPCQPCPQSDSETCVPMIAEALIGTWLEGELLEDVPQ